MMTCGVREPTQPLQTEKHVICSILGVVWPPKKVTFSYVICPSVWFGHDAAHMTCNQNNTTNNNSN